MSVRDADTTAWPLLAIPNFSAAREAEVVAAIGAALSGPAGVRLLDVHSDPDHNRSVFTLAGEPRALVDGLLAGAAVAVARVDLRAHAGRHPRVGVLDIAPFVHMDAAGRGAACAAALTLGDRLGQKCSLPVFLYGELTEFARTRADLRRGGPAELQRRIADGELTPDFGPRELHPTAGAALVAARAPLIAFNVLLAANHNVSFERAREIAAAIREGGADGLPGVRAIALELDQQGGAVQISTNIEDHRVASPAQVLAAVAARAQVASVELVGLPPEAALAGLPASLAIDCHGTLEAALGRRLA